MAVFRPFFLGLKSSGSKESDQGSACCDCGVRLKIDAAMHRELLHNCCKVFAV
jgi:hypothetical protein